MFICSSNKKNEKKKRKWSLRSMLCGEKILWCRQTFIKLWLMNFIGQGHLDHISNEIPKKENQFHVELKKLKLENLEMRSDKKRMKNKKTVHACECTTKDSCMWERWATNFYWLLLIRINQRFIQWIETIHSINSFLMILVISSIVYSNAT